MTWSETPKPGVEPFSFAFEDVSLELEGASILKEISVRSDARRIGVVGRNGSGKSSFAKLFAGLIPPTAGSVTVNGVDVARDRRAALSTVGILFQNPDHQLLFPTVEEELTFGLKQMGMRKDDITESVRMVLADFGKLDWIDRSVHSMSQGQKKLVCLLAVLVMAPKVIVLDEPLSGLDIPTKVQLARYLEAVDGALVHIAHDPGLLEQYDQVLWIDEGRLVANDKPDIVLPAFVGRMHEIGAGDALADVSS